MGRKRIDLSGKRFGRLTVIKYSYSDNNGNSYWVCSCDCGGDITTRASRLKEGSVKSCGCLLTDFNKTIINVGEKFGRLTVVEVVGKDKHKRFNYLCKCSCGNFIEVNRFR